MSNENKKTVGVILCGSGFKDGSEIRESVAVLWALSPLSVEVKCYAPDAVQADVVNCLTGKAAAGETRNMLVESARIARGKVEPLSQFDPSQLDALIIPGGFGAAKNLCTFATQGSQGTVREDVRQAIEKMFMQRKPIGAVCIAPAVVALSLPQKGLTLTLGERGEAAEEIEKLGHRHQVCAAHDCVVDTQNRVVSSPAYMDDAAPLHRIFEGIQKLVGEVVRLAQTS